MFKLLWLIHIRSWWKEIERFTAQTQYPQPSGAFVGGAKVTRIEGNGLLESVRGRERGTSEHNLYGSTSAFILHDTQSKLKFHSFTISMGISNAVYTYA